MRNSLFLALFTFAVAAVIMVASPANAIHKGAGALTCGNCHTMHSSQGGTNEATMGGSTGSFLLFRNSGVTDRSLLHLLCLQCHAQNGSQAGVSYAPYTTTAPKVYLTSAWDGTGFTDVGAGGDFSFVGNYTGSAFTLDTNGDSVNALGRGHSLGIADASPPGNTTDATAGDLANDLTTFSCTSCHDSHGTDVTTNAINKYRNLRAGSALDNNGALNYWENMATFGDLATSPYGGVSGLASGGGCSPCGSSPSTNTNIWPVYDATDGQNTYFNNANGDPVIRGAAQNNSGEGTQVGMSLFCAQCHGAWHEDFDNTNTNLAANGSDWRRHPVNEAIYTAASSTSGAGISITDFAHYTDTNINPVGLVLPASDGSSAGTYYASQNTDRVFCLSCHFAHGSKYYDILRWDYTSAVDTGSQTGNGVESNIGCQQCHNR